MAGLRRRQPRYRRLRESRCVLGLRRRRARGLPRQRALAELDREKHHAAREQREEDPAAHDATRRRDRNATRSARAAKPAQTKNAERDARVIVASIALTRRSRAPASAE